MVIFSVDLVCVEYTFYTAANFPGRVDCTSPIQHDEQLFHIHIAHGHTAFGIIERLERVRLGTNWDE